MRNLWTSASGVGSGKVSRDGPCQSRGKGRVGAAGTNAGALACTAKKAVIRFIACSVTIKDPAKVCTTGPVRPCDLDIDCPVQWAPSKSGMLGGLYFVASPAAY